MVMHMPSERRAQGTRKPRTRSASLQLKSGEWRPQEIAGLQSEASGSPQDEQSKEGLTEEQRLALQASKGESMAQAEQQEDRNTQVAAREWQEEEEVQVQAEQVLDTDTLIREQLRQPMLTLVMLVKKTWILSCRLKLLSLLTHSSKRVCRQPSCNS